MLKHTRWIGLILGAVLGSYLVLPLSAQNFIWGSINGIPYGPGAIFSGDVTFSPDECWLLREHIRALEGPRCTCLQSLPPVSAAACPVHGPSVVRS